MDSCSYEYFIIPGLSQDLETASGFADTEYHFEFVNCDTDGIEIDEIAFGHDEKYGNFKKFENKEKCTFDASDLNQDGM